MANAPVKPPPGMGRGGPGAPSQREPSSESGLRVAGNDASPMSGDRASLGALGVATRERGQSGPVRPPIGSDAGLAAPSPSDRARVPFAAAMPMAPEGDRKPPYALVVGLVAAISIAIPVILFLVLSPGGPDAAPRVTTQPSPDPIGLSGPRPKAGKGGASATPTQAPTPAPTPTIRNTNNAAPLNRPSPFRR
jgi:hypothetical protein